MKMKLLRTPDKYFENLPGFQFEPHYVEIDDGVDKIRMHYLDEGPPDGEIVLMLHGEPAWCYLYRRIIPGLAEAGFRCIAPDLIGFGRSDKPSEISDHTYGKHVKWMTQFVEKLDLRDINMYCNDWGSLIGLRVAIENEEMFNRIVLSNGGLPTGDERMRKGFMDWQELSRTAPKFPWVMMQQATVRRLTKEEMKAYQAPYPDPSYEAGPRIMPSLVPTTPDDPEHDANVAAREKYKHWTKPFLVAFGLQDAATGRAQKRWIGYVPGTNGQKHVDFEDCGHFVQDDKGPEMVEIIKEFIKDNPL